MRSKFAKSLFRRVTQFRRSIGNGSLVGPGLGIIGASHAGVEVDLLISRQHTTADQGVRFLHCGCSRFATPWEWPHMIPAQQHMTLGKSSFSRCGSNKRGELLRILPRVPAKLVYLARSRLDVQNRAVRFCF